MPLRTHRHTCVSKLYVHAGCTRHTALGSRGVNVLGQKILDTGYVYTHPHTIVNHQSSSVHMIALPKLNSFSSKYENDCII